LNRALTPISQATLGWPFSFALNRLLEAEPWARERLAPYAGETLELRVRPLPALRFVILPGGRLEAGGDSPAAVVTLAIGAPPRVEGEGGVAEAVRALATHLRWDPEEELSKAFGDVAAHRLAELGRGFVAWQADAARRVMDALADYAVEEKRALVAGPELARFEAEVACLNEALERLDERVRRLG
jgi:ubiquinone biosynthesis protein UbiJ